MIITDLTTDRCSAPQNMCTCRLHRSPDHSSDATSATRRVFSHTGSASAWSPTELAIGTSSSRISRAVGWSIWRDRSRWRATR